MSGVHAHLNFYGAAAWMLSPINDNTIFACTLACSTRCTQMPSTDPPQLNHIYVNNSALFHMGINKFEERLHRWYNSQNYFFGVLMGHSHLWFGTFIHSIPLIADKIYLPRQIISPALGKWVILIVFVCNWCTLLMPHMTSLHKDYCYIMSHPDL